MSDWEGFWFAAAISANHTIPRGVSIQSMPLALKARNKEEAIGKALLYCRETAYPITEGYYSHQASVVQVPNE